MEITEVRIKLMEDSDDRLQAFCSITVDDCFVIRDLKIIEGSHGPFVAMPSRKLTAHCSQCGTKNHLRSLYCNQCGSRLKEERVIRDQDGRTKLYADIAHPINSQCREKIQNRVIEEFRVELERFNQPDYVSRYDEDYDDSFDDADFEVMAPLAEPAPAEMPPAEVAPKRMVAEHSHIEPAEVEPRPPHRPPTPSPAKRVRPLQDQFGAGIFE